MMELLYFFIAQNIYWGLISFKFYTAGGRQAWEAFVPFHNLYVLMLISDRPKWWFFLFMVPVAGTVMAIVIIYELLHMYGFRKTWQTVAVVASLGLYLGYLNFTEDISKRTRDNNYIKSNLGEMVNAIFFAVVAATIIRSTTFEAYTIPTSSMEKSLMIGDFLFVSKLHYGVRLPMTPVCVPLVHNKIPFTNIQSYIEFPAIPYLRFPAFDPVEKNDVVVFNYPEELDKPIDKRENYVKRCVATPGDSLHIKDRVIYIDGQAQTLPDRSLGMFSYYVRIEGVEPTPDFFKRKFDINYNPPGLPNTHSDQGDVIMLTNNRPVYEYLMFIPNKKVDAMKQLDMVKEIIPINEKYDPAAYKDLPRTMRALLNRGDVQKRIMFPNTGDVHEEEYFKFTPDNFGPIWMPKAGSTITLNEDNVRRYRETINLYDGSTLVERDGQYFVNGEAATTYTFNQNYYWMMGDNRHNSLDSRFWGYVPEDHIVGKPVFIWMSWDQYGKGIDKIRTDRVFTTVHGEGQRKSYFWPVAIIAALLYGANQWRKKKKAQKG